MYKIFLTFFFIILVTSSCSKRGSAGSNNTGTYTITQTNFLISIAAIDSNTDGSIPATVLYLEKFLR